MTARAMVALLVVAGAIAAVFGGRAHAQETPTLAVQPAELTVGVNDGAFSVEVMIDDVTNEQGLGGYTLIMRFDPAVLNALAIEDGGFVTSSAQNAVICPTTGINNEDGSVAIFCFTIPLLAKPGVMTTTPRVLTTVQFEPAGLGTTDLDISETTLTDAQGSTLAVASTNGSITVSDAPPPADRDEPATGADEEPNNAPAEEPRDAPAEAAADGEARDGETDLPTTGAGPDTGGNGGLFILSWALAGAGALLVASAAVVRRARRERR